MRSAAQQACEPSNCLRTDLCIPGRSISQNYCRSAAGAHSIRDMSVTGTNLKKLTNSGRDWCGGQT
jgi:hypothetical protein